MDQVTIIISTAGTYHVDVEPGDNLATVLDKAEAQGAPVNKVSTWRLSGEKVEESRSDWHKIEVRPGVLIAGVPKVEGGAR